MTVDGIQAVQARMAELRALVSAPATTATTTTTTTGATSAADFETTLASVTGSGAATATGAGGSAQGPTGQALLAAAEKYIGTPYVWGGESLDEGGLDCSGLVLRSLADIGVTDVPRVARDQQKLGTAVPSLDQALPGDLLVFGGGTHIAIYEGDGKMIDAPKPGGKVGIRDVWGTPTAIRRILPQQSTGTDLAAQVRSVLGASGSSSLASASASSASQRAQLDLLASLGGAGAFPSAVAS